MGVFIGNVHICRQAPTIGSGEEDGSGTNVVPHGKGFY